MARRQLLTDEERRLLLGVPRDPDALARHYTFTRSDQDLVAGRRGATLAHIVPHSNEVRAPHELHLLPEERRAQAALLSEIAPIDDVRSSADYRRRVAANLLARFIAGR